VTANGSNPFLSATEMKTKAPGELSEQLSCVEHVSSRITFSSLLVGMPRICLSSVFSSFHGYKVQGKTCLLA
jgi:hypothetical protein